jgi:hypothetical protein
MTSETVEPQSEMEILRRIIEQDEPLLSAEAARAILRFEFSPADHNRMNRLAEKNRRGKLTPVEKQELDNYTRVGQVLGILKSKARRSLKERQRSRDNDT